MPTSLGKNALLVLAITLHNIPEGLSIGVAFGGVVSGNSHATFLGAIGLAIGIGIQNIPEGAALSMPIRAAGATRWKHTKISYEEIYDDRFFHSYFL